jgi:hypothetical protein
VIGHFLATGRHIADDGSAGELEVRAAEISVAGDEEELLFKADVHVDSLDALVAEEVEEASALARQCIGCAEKRGLLVEGVAIVRHQACRDEDGVSTEKDRGSGIHSQVTASTVGGAKTAVEVGGSICLAFQDVLALEVPNRLSLSVELNHRILYLGALSVANTGRADRLKPVTVDRGSIVPRPFRNGLRNLSFTGADMNKYIG